MKLQKFFKLAIFALALTAFGAACVKEGPPGKDGADGATGAAGANGKDANETCKMCHNPASVDAIAFQFQLSKHEYGLAAEEEAGSNTCGPCHLQESFRYVVKNNVPATFTIPTGGTKYVNNYMSSTSTAYGELGCRTCHSSIHETYTSTDLPKLTTTAAVPMSMWGGAKTINLPADGGSSNLCVKCHQPRPFTFNNSKNPANTGNVLDYSMLVSKPNDIFFDGSSAATIAQAQILPGYRTHTHYGTAGAMYAGMGGIEFSGAVGYASAIHKTAASCGDCHMATMTGRAGGHTFKMRNAADGAGLTSSTSWNFNGCNVSGCHASTPVTTTNAKYWVNPRADIKSKLDALAAKLKYNGVEFLNKNPDGESNLWKGITTNNYDGYLNVYDPLTNPEGLANNGTCFQNANPSASWTAEQKAINLTLPVLKLTNAQFGAIINFQMCLRDYSLGIHNYDYAKALLANSIAILN